MKRALAVLAALPLIAAAERPSPLQPSTQPFRVGVLTGATAACAPPPTSAPAGERAYFDHLSKRLQRPVLACPVASATEAAAALAAGRLDMAPLDEASYAPVRASVRATMSVRRSGALARVPVVFAVMNGRKGDAAALKGRAVAFGGSGLSGLALPKQVLSEQGFGPEVLHDVTFDDETAALSALRSGKADAVALQAAAWQRQCEGRSPTDHPCADLTVLWRARPKADRAFAVRRDLPEPERYRLIGVHLAMHLEDKPAFAWAASQLDPDAANFEPAEAEALTVARLP